MSRPGSLQPNSGNMNTNQLISNYIYTRSLPAYSGRLGPPGPPGGTGPKGEIGDDGPKGSFGPKGSQGEKGEKGRQGDIGIGEKGDQGIKGTLGEQGDQGFTGITGPKGQKGEIGIGEKGDQGIQGIKGIAGDAVIGNLDQTINSGATTTATVYLSTLNVNNLSNNTNNAFINLFNGAVKFTNDGAIQKITSRYDDNIFLNVNEVAFNGQGIVTNLFTANSATVKGILTTGNIVTNGSGMDTRIANSNSGGALNIGGVVNAYGGVSTGSIDNVGALTIGANTTSISIGKSNTTTTMNSALSGNTISGTSISSVVGTFSSNVAVASLSSTNFALSSSGIGTFAGVTCSGGLTSGSITSGAIASTSLSTGIGTFTGITCGVNGLTVSSIYNPYYSVSNTGIAIFVGITCGTIISNGTIQNTATNPNYSILSSGDATFESVICKSRLTLRSASTTLTDAAMYMNTGSNNSFSMFSRKNGIVLSVTQTIVPSTVVYDSIYSLPAGFASDAVVNLPSTGPTDFSPLRFYIYNNNATKKITVQCSSAILYGPATGGSVAALSVIVPPLKRLIVTFMTTDNTFISIIPGTTTHYHVVFENNPDSVDVSLSGFVNVGTVNATGVTIGKIGSTTTVQGTLSGSTGSFQDVIISNTPTLSTHATTKQYVDAKEINTVYLSGAAELSTVVPSNSKSTSVYVVPTQSYTNTPKVITSFTLPTSLYKIKAGKMTVTIPITTPSSYSTMQVIGRLWIDGTTYPTTDSSNIDVGTVTGTASTISSNALTTLSITLPDLTASGITLQLFGNSPGNGINTTMNIYYGGIDSFMTTMTTTYPLYNQLYNPVGTIIMYAGSINAPRGYLFCDGTNYSATGIYSDLYGVLGIVYGGSSGVNFNVPDLKSRFPIGSSSVGTITSPLTTTATGGTATIAIGNLPNHTHELPVGLLTSASLAFSAPVLDYGSGSGSRSVVTSVSASLSTTATLNNQTYTIDNSYGNSPYYQPHTVVNYIIKY